MKKSLLLAAAFVACMSANAQVTWTMVSGADAVTVPQAEVASEGLEALEPVLGSGLSYNGVDTKHKDETGTSIPWIGDGSTGYIKIQPTNATVPNADGTKQVTGDPYRNLNSAAASGQDMWIDFTTQVPESNQDGLLTVSSVEFYATKVGTDGAMVNAAIYYNDDPSTIKNYLITPANADDVDGEGGGIASDGVGGHWNGETGDAWADTNDAGYRPDRNDASKAQNSANCYTHFTIPVTDVPDDAYSATLRVYVYGISSNKQVLIHDVKINANLITDGIKDVTAAKANVKAPAYNVAGQKVSKDYKGVVISNGKKYIQK